MHTTRTMVSLLILALMGCRAAMAQTEIPYHDKGVSWSLDGSRVAFFSNRSGGDDIYVRSSISGRIFFASRLDGDGGWSILSVRPDGRDRRVEVAYAGGQGEYNPALAPDGRTLVFNTYRYGGWKLARLARGVVIVERTSGGAEYYTNAAISPDGARMLFERNARQGTDVMLADVDGSRERNLTAAFGPGEERVPDWLPDGRGFVFFGDRDGHQQIYRVKLDGTALLNLSRSQGNDFAPAVSPDGRRVAFYSDRDGNLDVFVMDVDGTNVRNLTASFQSAALRWSYSGRTFWPYKLDWSPDGTHLVYVVREGDDFALWILAVDGGAPEPVEIDVRSPITPAWSRSP